MYILTQLYPDTAASTSAQAATGWRFSAFDLTVLHRLRIIDFICNLHKDNTNEAKEAAQLKREK